MFVTIKSRKIWAFSIVFGIFRIEIQGRLCNVAQKISNLEA